MAALGDPPARAVGYPVGYGHRARSDEEDSMISIRHFIDSLNMTVPADIQEDAQVWVQVDVAGQPHRLALGSMTLHADGKSVVLVGEPAPVPDPVVTPVPGVYRKDQHQHIWSHDISREIWECTYRIGCVTITHEELIGHPIPETEAQGFALLNHIAELKITPQPADAPILTSN